MAIIAILFAVALGFAARNSRQRRLRIFLAGCCALNAVAAVAMVSEGYPYAFKLRPWGQSTWQEESRR